MGTLSLYLTTLDKALALLADAAVQGLSKGSLGVLMLVEPAILVCLGAAIGEHWAARDLIPANWTV